MALIRCPDCGLPRTEADARVACPVCGHVPGQIREVPAIVEPAPVVLIAAEATAPARPTRASLAVWFGGGTVLGLGLGLGIGLLLRNATPTPPLASNSVPEPMVSGTSTSTREVLPGPQLAREEAPFPTLVHAGPTVPEVKPAPGVTVIRLDRPKEAFTLDPIAEGNQIKLVGKVGKLLLHGLAAGATLDASELETDYASVKGPIEGGSTLLLHVPNGNVHFSHPIRQGSKVTVDAPGGYVSFSRSNANTDGAKIADGSQVQIMTRSAVFVGHIVGAKTRVEVSFTTGGSMRFYQISDSAKLHYRLADPNAIAPRVNPGTILDDAECKRIN